MPFKNPQPSLAHSLHFLYFPATSTLPDCNLCSVSHASSYLLLFKILLCLFPCLTLFRCSDSGSCLLFHISPPCYSVCIQLQICLPCPNPAHSNLSLHIWFPTTPPSFPGSALHLSLCYNKYLGSFIPVSWSESALGFPCANTTFQLYLTMFVFL